MCVVFFVGSDQQGSDHVGITAHNTCGHLRRNKPTWRSKTGNLEEEGHSEMILEDCNPVPQCHKDGCASSTIQSGPFKMVNHREHFSISDSGIKIRASCYAMHSLANWTLRRLLKMCLIKHITSRYITFLAKHLFISTVLQMLILPAVLTLMMLLF